MTYIFTFLLYSPAHSFILDSNDDMWNDVFTEEEMKEIEEKAEKEEFEEELPGDLINYSSRLNGKVIINYRFYQIFMSE